MQVMSVSLPHICHLACPTDNDVISAPAAATSDDATDVTSQIQCRYRLNRKH